MALLFEFCFYAGVLFTLVGLIWLLRCLFGGNLRKAIVPLGVLLVGAALLVGPAIVSHNMAVDLGARETLVGNERHITLTGWDGESYEFLAAKPDTVVLHMGNPDVTDSTLQFLSGMSELRELDLNDSIVSDTGLIEIARLPALKTLRLRATNVTDGGFREHLAKMASLRQVDVRATSVSTEAVEKWKSAEDGRRAFQ